MLHMDAHTLHFMSTQMTASNFNVCVCVCVCVCCVCVCVCVCVVCVYVCVCVRVSYLSLRSGKSPKRWRHFFEYLQVLLSTLAISLLIRTPLHRRRRHRLLPSPPSADYIM